METEQKQEEIAQATQESHENRENSELDKEFREAVEKTKLEAFDKANFLLTKGGLKPACTFELLIRRQTDEDSSVFLTEEDIKNAINVVEKSGLYYQIKPKETVKSSYTTSDEPEEEKTMIDERIEILVARSKEDLKMLKKYWGTDNHEAIGKVLGFPLTAVDAFTGKKEMLDLDSLPQNIKESDAVAFLTPTLSKDNWKGELAEGKKRAEFIKRNSPEIYREMIKIYRQEKSPQQKWEEIRQKVEKIGDTLGQGIDKNIKETVTALSVHEINSSGSCEGHIDWGNGAPWVEINAPNEPEEIYKNEKVILERTARENNITVEDLKLMENEKTIELYRKAMDECAANGETEEMILWEKENEKLRMIMEKVLEEFYQSRETSEEAKIKFEEIGGFGTFRIYSGTKEDYKREVEKMTDKDKKRLGKRLKIYRQEMQEFSQFMKDKFFKNGGGYISAIRKKVQEEIDQNEANKARELIRG